MKFFRKIAALCTAAAIAVSAAAATVMTAGAESIADTAKAISSGKTYSYTFPGSTDYTDYKITSSGKGTLSVKIEGSIQNIYLQVFDENFNKVSLADDKITTGTYAKSGTGLIITSCYQWNDIAEKLNITANWMVNKGTYYIRISNVHDYYYQRPHSGTVNITATYPTAAKKATISYITITLKKGDTLSLGAALSGGSGTVTWKSSKPSVATVSTSGKITAKNSGSTIITAKCGTSSKKIKIIVK